LTPISNKEISILVRIHQELVY